MIAPSPAGPQRAFAATAVIFLLGVLVATAQSTPKKVLPSYVPVCARAEADLAGCVRRAVEALRPRLRSGLKRLRVPAIDPFRLPALAVRRDLPALSVNASLEDLYVTGAGDFQIRKISVDPNALTLSGEFVLPRISVRSRYAVAGRLLTAPLLGRGNFKGNFSDVVATASGRGRRSKEGGVEHVEITDLRVKLRLGGSEFDFDNDDPSADATAAAALSFIRGNTDAALEVVTPVVEEVVTPVVEEVAAEVALQIINSIFARLPLAEILPDA